MSLLHGPSLLAAARFWKSRFIRLVRAMIDRCLKEDCQKCPNLSTARTRIVPGYGDLKSSLMIVGLAPGRLGADITGIPFTRDASGRLMQQALIDSGLSHEESPEVDKPQIDVYLTNLVKCNPRDLLGRNRNPTRKEIDNCWEYLLEEMEQIKPTHVVAVGRTVFDTLIRKERMLSTREERSASGPEIVFIYHPAYAIRGGGGKIRRDCYSDYFLRTLADCGCLRSQREPGG